MLESTLQERMEKDQRRGAGVRKHWGREDQKGLSISCWQRRATKVNREGGSRRYMRTYMCVYTYCVLIFKIHEDEQEMQRLSNRLPKPTHGDGITDTSIFLTYAFQPPPCNEYTILVVSQNYYITKIQILWTTKSPPRCSHCASLV